MTDFEPKQFGKYFLLEKLAVGGMAEIYKAKTFGVDGFEKLLAIKRILPHCSADKDFITMLVDEAKLSVTLSHANIVQVYDLGKVGDDYFISMEYISGPNLRDVMYRCREKGMKIPPEIAVYITSEICKGLDYAHRKVDASNQPLNIVHRDVSPQNILISYEGEIKIVDFGIAKAAMNISHTMAGILKGKIAYMSPEQALGKPIDYRTDLFSAGIILYEAMTGEKLFTGESQFEVLKKIRTTRIDATKMPETIPEDLKNILAKALAYLPKDRYQSAGDMQTALTRYLYTNHVDFAPQKIAAFIREVFADEIAKQREKGALDASLEAQTSSINLAQEALQENLVHREDTGQTTANVTGAAEAITGSSFTNKESTEPTTVKKGLFKKVAIVAGVAAAIVGIGISYIKFIQPKTAAPKYPPVATITGTINVSSSPDGAKILLDGKDTDLTTPAILENLTLNKSYTIKLIKDQFIDTEKKVTVSSVEPIGVDFILESSSGILEVVSEPSGADISINGRSIGEKTPTKIKDLPLNIDLKIILTKPGFKDLEQIVTLTSSKLQNLTAKLVSSTQEVGSIQIISNPVGADIFINGRNTGLVTPATAKDIPLGEKQNIRLAKQGYAGVTKTITLRDKTPLTISSDLIPTMAKEEKKVEEKKLDVTSAKITSKPAGAKILLNGKSTGLKTPATLKNFEVGKAYTIRLEKQDFEPWTKEITVSSAELITIKSELKEIKKEEKKEKQAPPPEEPVISSSEPATLKVSSDPSGAEVFINGELKGKTPVTITDIRPGLITLLINKEGKARFSQKISFKAGEKKDLGSIVLGEVYGSVSIVTTPPKADVIFDGENIGAKTPVTIKKVRRDKEHTVKLTLDGYKTWQRTFEMQESEEKKFNVILEEE